MKVFSAIGIVVALVCLGYGRFIASGRSGTHFYRVWYGIGLLLGAVAGCGLAGIFELLPAGVTAVFGILVTVVLFLSFILGAVILSRYDEKGRPGLSYIIVLGAQIRPDGPSRVCRQRLQAAADYLNRNPETRCILSGARGRGEPCTEAEAMAEDLQKRGIAADRLLQEDASRTTLENLQNSRKIINDPDASVGIVTNDFHMYRSLCLAKKAGYTNVCGISAASSRRYLPNNLLREIMAVVKNHSW